MNTIRIIICYGYQLKYKNVNNLTKVIYNNFIDIAHITELDHTFHSIQKILHSKSSIILLAIDSQQCIISYVVADNIYVNDLNLMHIYYIYTAKEYRNCGIGTYLLNTLSNVSMKRNIPILSLTYDTQNVMLTKYYKKYGFDFDDQLRSHKRYDMLSKQLY